MRRITAATLLLLLTGCGSFPVPVVAAGAADLTAVTVFHRDIVDLVVSSVSGRDCSIVRLDRGQSYCRPLDPPAEPPPYCTRTLGLAECWATPLMLPNPPRGLADGPWALTPEQEADRTHPF